MRRVTLSTGEQEWVIPLEEGPLVDAARCIERWCAITGFVLKPAKMQLSFWDRGRQRPARRRALLIAGTWVAEKDDLTTLGITFNARDP